MWFKTEAFLEIMKTKHLKLFRIVFVAKGEHSFSAYYILTTKPFHFVLAHQILSTSMNWMYSMAISISIWNIQPIKEYFRSFFFVDQLKNILWKKLKHLFVFGKKTGIRVNYWKCLRISNTQWLRWICNDLLLWSW